MTGVSFGGVSRNFDPVIWLAGCRSLDVPTSLCCCVPSPDIYAGGIWYLGIVNVI